MKDQAKVAPRPLSIYHALSELSRVQQGVCCDRDGPSITNHPKPLLFEENKIPIY